MTEVEFFILNSADLWYVPCSKLLWDVENHKLSETDQKMSVNTRSDFMNVKMQLCWFCLKELHGCLFNLRIKDF